MTPRVTLAELLKTAKVAGQDLVFDPWCIKVCEGGVWWLKIVYGPLNILTGGTIIRDEVTARRCCLAALLALPQARKEKKR